jgi:hypothetical protein
MPDVDSGLLVHASIASIKNRERRAHLSGKRQQKPRVGYALRAEIGPAIGVDRLAADTDVFMGSFYPQVRDEVRTPDLLFYS